MVDCRYYTRSFMGSLTPVFSSRHPEESAANLFLAAMDRDVTVDIHQSIYGFKHLDYQINASQWVAYCQKQGMTTYFAIEKEEPDSYTAFIISESKSLAFNHILSVTIPKTFISDKSVTLKAKLNAFIPTHNISNLY